MIETELFTRLRELEKEIRGEFGQQLEQYDNPKHVDDLEGWDDHFYRSSVIRKCHIKTIEPDGNKRKLWLMHINIFPEFNVDLPIFGLDIVANPKRISGCFCDYSPVTDTAHHPYLEKFKHVTKDLEWTRARVLPEWALEIFSENMVAAGNIKEGVETDQLCDMAMKLVQFYLLEMNNPIYVKDINTREAHNKYCRNQKMNKALHSSILSMGVDEERKNQYVEEILFEEIV